MKSLTKISILLLFLIMLLTVGCVNPFKEINNLKEMDKAMEEGLGLIDEKKTLNFYKKSCSFIKDNGLSDSFSMEYLKNNDKSVNVEFNSICKGVLVEYIYGSDSYGDALLFKEGLTLSYSDKTKKVSEIETTWDDYSEYFEKFREIKSGLIKILESIEPDEYAGYESDEGLPYNVEISYKKKDIKKLKVFDFDIESLDFYFACDEEGEKFSDFSLSVYINKFERWKIWFGDSPITAISYEKMKEDFDLHL